MRALALSGLTLATLGTVHLMAHFSMRPEDAPPVAVQMQQTTIELLGTHTLLQFHIGFSVTMGALLVAYGAMVGLIAAEPQRRAVRLLHAAVCVVMVALTVVYFHPLAWGLCLVALVMAAMSLRFTPSPA